MDEKGRSEEVGVIDTWLDKHRPIWVGATRHPFILTIADGTIDISAFKTWLGQDYIFVRTLVPFVGSLIVKAWKESDNNISDVDVILSGLASLKEELEWFKAEASKWGVDLSLNHLVPLNQNLSYCRFLEFLISPDIEYTVAITAFWAIETVYQDSFALCIKEGAKTPIELRETCQRWGNEAFADYCQSLRGISDRQLKHGRVSDAEQVFLQVLTHEIEFWDMSRG